MADQSVGIDTLTRGIENLNTLDIQIGGDDQATWEAPSGEQGISFNHAVRKLFENGGLPAKPFPTKAIMTTDGASLADGTLAQVYNETSNNGLYLKSAGTWVKSAYDPLVLAKNYVDSSQAIEQKTSAADFTEDGKYIQNLTGILGSNPEFKSTGYVLVEPDVTYTYVIGSGDNTGAAFFDESKVLISTFGANSNGTTEKTITSPSNARYVRLSTYKTTANPYFKGFGRYNIDKIFSVLNLYPKSELLQKVYKQSDYTSSGYVHIDSGLFLEAASYKRTDYIAIEPNVEYKVLSASTFNAACAWYDKDKVFISGFRADTVTNITSPTNAAFVALSTKTADLPNVFFTSKNERYDASKVMSIVNAHLDISSDFDISEIMEVINKATQVGTVVNSLAALQTVNTEGTGDRAYPIGRRVYDHSLRSEVYADGSFWRMPDGSAANLARRTYVFPDWEESRKALPTYAKSYRNLLNAETNTVEAWSYDKSKVSVSKSTKYGDNKVLIESSLSTSNWVILNNSSAATLHSFLIFDFHVDFSNTDRVDVGLFAADGTLLFSRWLTASVMGSYVRPFYDDDLVQAEVKISTLTPAFEGASLANVKHVGFSVRAKTGKTAQIYVGNIDTVSFKPMVTLRFDDQRGSVYRNAYPIMQQYGFKGLIAVVTGAKELAADPDHDSYGRVDMSKAELLDVQALGWDLVSHTHTHMAYEDKTDAYIQEDYRKSQAYLRNELGVSDLASSILVSPYNRRDERAAAIQREFFDCQINLSHINSHMPRQPEGTWKAGSLWSSMGSVVGDGKNGTELIAKAQQAIDEQRWQTFMFHEIIPDPTTSEASTTVLPADFAQFCAWLDANRDMVDVVTVTDVVRKIRPVG